VPLLRRRGWLPWRARHAPRLYWHLLLLLPLLLLLLLLLMLLLLLLLDLGRLGEPADVRRLVPRWRATERRRGHCWLLWTQLGVGLHLHCLHLRWDGRVQTVRRLSGPLSMRLAWLLLLLLPWLLLLLPLLLLVSWG